MFGSQRHFIQEQQIGLLFDESGFQKILPAGQHRLSSKQTLELCKLSDFPASIPELNWLASKHQEKLNPYLEILQTGVEELALVTCGLQMHLQLPGTLQAFWKHSLPLEIKRLQLPANLKVPSDWLAKLPTGVSHSYIKQVVIPSGSIGLLFADNLVYDFLSSGRHAYFEVLPNTRLQQFRLSQVISNKEIIQALIASAHPACAEQFQMLSTSETQIALCWDQKELVHVSAPASIAMVSKTLRIEVLEQNDAPRIVETHLVPAVRSTSSKLLAPYLTNCGVASGHVGLLHVDGVFQNILQPGYYSYWHGGKDISVVMVDQRLTTLEISGQEMLTQDKVPMRVNVTAGYRITEPQLMISNLHDYKDFIYKEIQFALRAAVGSKSLDGLLESKNETDAQILDYMRQKAAAQGIEMLSLGIKDLILPGEIKTMLGKVVEAEKAAQANVIRRREETAATRSLMNTSKVMENSSVALRLKELETLERITEKIDKISVYGGLEGLLQQLAPFKLGPTEQIAEKISHSSS